MAKQFPYKFISKKGNNVTFRYLRKNDLDAMLSYINTLIAEDTYIGMYGTPLTREEESKHLNESLESIEKNEKRIIVVEIEGKYVGSGDLRRETIRRKKHMGNIGISLLKEFREEGIGAELLATLIEEGRKLGLKLLHLTCLENNDRALHLYEKLGFKRCGFIPNACFWKGGYVGEVTLYLPLKKF